MDVQLRRGLIEICVLAAMLRGPTYGYKLIRDVEPYMERSESTLYPILRRLEVAFLTACTVQCGRRLRQYCRVTPSGLSRIEAIRRGWKDIPARYKYVTMENTEDGAAHPAGKA